MAKAQASSLPSRQVKTLVAVGITLVLILTMLFLGLGRLDGLADQHGILGTNASLFADLNLIAQIVLLCGLVAGFFLARLGRISAHQYNQTGWVLFNSVLVAFIMVVSYNQNIVPQLPGVLGTLYGILPTLHASLGALAVLCGFYLILRMNALLPKAWRIKRWKNLMRITLVLYLLVGVFGLAIYYTWYLA